MFINFPRSSLYHIFGIALLISLGRLSSESRLWSLVFTILIRLKWWHALTNRMISKATRTSLRGSILFPRGMPPDPHSLTIPEKNWLTNGDPWQIFPTNDYPLLLPIRYCVETYQTTFCLVQSWSLLLTLWHFEREQALPHNPLYSYKKS